MSENTGNNRNSTVLDRKPELKNQRPRLYKVILLNDDFTPMDFVVMVLMDVFHKTMDEAFQIMMDVHKKGAGIAGVFTMEIAESKVSETISMAQKHEHPLLAKMEPESNGE